MSPVPGTSLYCAEASVSSYLQPPALHTSLAKSIDTGFDQNVTLYVIVVIKNV